MESKKAPGFVKNLPNILSCIRIGGALSLPFLIRESWEINITLPFIYLTLFNVPIIWIVVFFVLACTDKVDGSLARKLKAESALGAKLDKIGDALVLAIGAALCFVFFVRESLEDWQFRLYIGMLILVVLNQAVVYIFAYIYHGKGNMVHSYYQKTFAVATYVCIILWAFLRTIPEWTIYTVFAISIIATVEECIYNVRTAKYSADFKGHGFEKYEKRADLSR